MKISSLPTCVLERLLDPLIGPAASDLDLYRLSLVTREWSLLTAKERHLRRYFRGKLWDHGVRADKNLSAAALRSTARLVTSTGLAQEAGVDDLRWKTNAIISQHPSKACLHSFGATRRHRHEDCTSIVCAPRGHHLAPPICTLQAPLGADRACAAWSKIVLTEQWAVAVSRWPSPENGRGPNMPSFALGVWQRTSGRWLASTQTVPEHGHTLWHADELGVVGFCPLNLHLIEWTEQHGWRDHPHLPVGSTFDQKLALCKDRIWLVSTSSESLQSINILSADRSRLGSQRWVQTSVRHGIVDPFNRLTIESLVANERFVAGIIEVSKVQFFQDNPATLGLPKRFLLRFDRSLPTQPPAMVSVGSDAKDLSLRQGLMAYRTHESVNIRCAGDSGPGQHMMVEHGSQWAMTPNGWLMMKPDESILERRLGDGTL